MCSDLGSHESVGISDGISSRCVNLHNPWAYWCIMFENEGSPGVAHFNEKFLQ